MFRLLPVTHPTEETEFGSSPEMWATPNTVDHLHQRSKEALEKQATTTRKGRSRPANLREQVNPETVKAWRQAQEPTMWATPSAADSTGSTGGNQNKSLRTDVKMWPTPTARDYKGARKPETLKAVGRDAKNSLPDAVRSGLWPTPTANEDAAGTPNGKMQKQLGNHPEVRGTTPEEWKRGTLNPQWVEWLMGYPPEWTALED